jgi:hypothetical protein
MLETKTCIGIKSLQQLLENTAIVSHISYLYFVRDSLGILKKKLYVTFIRHFSALSFQKHVRENSTIIKNRNGKLNCKNNRPKPHAQ